MQTILVVDDEKPIVEILQYNLEKEGYRVVTAFNGEDALHSAAVDRPDLIILDIMLPRKDGFTVCRELRSFTSVPIIMLTARDMEMEKVHGFELGADDYVTKPFSAREIIARVKAILRRHNLPGAGLAAGQIIIDAGYLRLDPKEFQVYLGGAPVELTLREYNLLHFLMINPNHVFSREQLLSQVWGYDYLGDERTVDVTVRRLREKLETHPRTPRYIRTKRGVGYYFQSKDSV